MTDSVEDMYVPGEPLAVKILGVRWLKSEEWERVKLLVESERGGEYEVHVQPSPGVSIGVGDYAHLESHRVLVGRKWCRRLKRAD